MAELEQDTLANEELLAAYNRALRGEGNTAALRGHYLDATAEAQRGDQHFVTRLRYRCQRPDVHLQRAYVIGRLLLGDLGLSRDHVKAVSLPPGVPEIDDLLHTEMVYYEFWAAARRGTSKPWCQKPRHRTARQMRPSWEPSSLSSGTPRDRGRHDERWDCTTKRTMAGWRYPLWQEAEPFWPRGQQHPPVVSTEGQDVPTKHVQLPRAQQPAPNDPPGIRVAVWKVDGLGGGAHRHDILQALAALHADVVLLQDTHLYRDADLRAAERQWRRWGPSLWTQAEAAGKAPTAKAGGGRHGATAQGERTTVAQPRGGTALLGCWSNASWTMQVMERPDRYGGAHVIDIAMNPRHLRG
ncbi:UNVERIFIED_CONTAM: hypothetical protein K2H54_001583 [Gekko kuhli]